MKLYPHEPQAVSHQPNDFPKLVIGFLDQEDDFLVLIKTEKNKNKAVSWWWRNFAESVHNVTQRKKMIWLIISDPWK